MQAGRCQSNQAGTTIASRSCKQSEKVRTIKEWRFPIRVELSLLTRAHAHPHIAKLFLAMHGATNSPPTPARITEPSDSRSHVWSFDQKFSGFHSHLAYSTTTPLTHRPYQQSCRHPFAFLPFARLGRAPYCDPLWGCSGQLVAAMQRMIPANCQRRPKRMWDRTWSSKSTSARRLLKWQKFKDSRAPNWIRGRRCRR